MLQAACPRAGSGRSASALAPVVALARPSTPLAAAKASCSVCHWRWCLLVWAPQAYPAVGSRCLMVVTTAAAAAAAAAVAAATLAVMLGAAATALYPNCHRRAVAATRAWGCWGAALEAIAHLAPPLQAWGWAVVGAGAVVAVAAQARCLGSAAFSKLHNTGVMRDVAPPRACVDDYTQYSLPWIHTRERVGSSAQQATKRSTL